MANDIDAVIKQLALVRPDIGVKKLTVSHEADDDGIWFFSIGRKVEVQLESSSGNFPFLVETNAHVRRMTVHSIDQAIAAICSALAAEK